jgi:transcriptional regulator with XRE-family HTH domain
MLISDVLNLLREQVKFRIRSGEITERGLARLTGLSQSHIHNVLKGARILTPDVADALIRHLRISLLELLADSSSELRLRKGPGRGLNFQADSRRISVYVSKT